MEFFFKDALQRHERVHQTVLPFPVSVVVRVDLVTYVQTSIVTVS
jgi:hypothetical protein